MGIKDPRIRQVQAYITIEQEKAATIAGNPVTTTFPFDNWIEDVIPDRKLKF